MHDGLIPPRQRDRLHRVGEVIRGTVSGRQVRAARGYGNDPASRRAALIRGMIATLSADLVEASRGRIERWLESSHVTTSDEFYARRNGLPGDLVGFSDSGKRLYVELREFVYRHIIHSFPVSRHDGHARRVLAGVFSAYRDNPRLLPDDVLRLMERELSVRFLREVALPQVEREVAEHYRPHPAFYRAIADHIAGMTDSYCNSEYRQLVVE
jgi:dGTPase